MPKKEMYTVNLRTEQVEKLRALSAATRVPAAVHVRAAVDAYLNKSVASGRPPGGAPGGADEVYTEILEGRR